jgi:hypothetical protein
MHIRNGIINLACKCAECRGLCYRMLMSSEIFGFKRKMSNQSGRGYNRVDFSVTNTRKATEQKPKIVRGCWFARWSINP